MKVRTMSIRNIDFCHTVLSDTQKANSQIVFARYARQRSFDLVEPKKHSHPTNGFCARQPWKRNKNENGTFLLLSER